MRPDELPENQPADNNMTTPTQKQKQLAERIVNRLTFAERVSTPKDYTVVAQLLADAQVEENSAAQKDRDCWLFNAQELQKQVNKMEKELGEYKSVLNNPLTDVPMDRQIQALNKELGELRRDKETWEFHKQVFRGFSKELTGYFVLGGLFNPEMANHDAVSDLLMRIRKALDATIQKAT